MWVCPTRILSIALAILLSSTPELMSAVAAQDTSRGQPAAVTPTDSSQKTTPSTTDPGGRTPEPEPATSTAQTNTGAQRPPDSEQQPSQPEGTAAARAAKTIGGPASKPAGSAIAPAKQKQGRSWLIKVGAIAGAGAALGIVYALTRATPTRPPGAH
jgi:cobalamin biosynthesis Mg chelatase CobN